MPVQPKEIPNAATLLSKRILTRKDFIELLSNLENSVAELILEHKDASESIEEQLPLGLRFADILSQSSESEHRGTAYLLIALYLELIEWDQFSEDSMAMLDLVSTTVFAALGNFPALQKLETKPTNPTYIMPSDRFISRRLKEEFQQSIDGKYVLTDTQYQITTDMQNSKFYSFSGPTSLGKSFILKDFIKSEILNAGKRCLCIVYLVPTNALVAQTANDLRAELSDLHYVNVATHPYSSHFLSKKFRSTVYVFTPERLIRYLSSSATAVALLIVDEAHRILGAKDGRSPLFYYGILETIQRHSPKVIFSSPALSNPDIFLNLFGRTNDKSFLARERSVVQQRFLIDFINEKIFYFSSSSEMREIELASSAVFGLDLWDAIRYWSRGTKSLIYANTPNKVVDFALSFHSNAEHPLGFRAKTLITRIEEELHPHYYLIDALKKGIAFHHGRIPLELREEVEALFKDPESGIDYLVCTSTLLEGVNLPAKNLFILTDKHGSGQTIQKLDFENLAGRAGRLTKDYKGNVFCVRLKETEWAGYVDRIGVVDPQPVSSFLLPKDGRKRKEYTDIEKILADEALPERPAVEQEMAERYAAVLLIQHMANHESLLVTSFKERAADPGKTLMQAVEKIGVNIQVLKQSPELDPLLQESVRRKLSRLQFPITVTSSDGISFDSLFSVLKSVSDLYDWKERESRGRGAMFRRNSSASAYELRLKYWSLLVFKWVSGKPLNLVIRESISHYQNIGEIWLPNFSAGKNEKPYKREEFDPQSKEHINQVIEETMKDLDYGVGYRIHYYLKNYYALCVDVFGEEKAGIDLSILLEYGSSDPVAIELQELGYSRESARKIRKDGISYLEFSQDGKLVGIDIEGIFSDEAFDKTVIKETKNIFSV